LYEHGTLLLLPTTTGIAISPLKTALYRGKIVDIPYRAGILTLPSPAVAGRAWDGPEDGSGR